MRREVRVAALPLLTRDARIQLGRALNLPVPRGFNDSEMRAVLGGRDSAHPLVIEAKRWPSHYLAGRPRVAARGEPVLPKSYWRGRTSPGAGSMA